MRSSCMPDYGLSDDDRPGAYFSSHHSFSLRTCSSSCGEKSLAVEDAERKNRLVVKRSRWWSAKCRLLVRRVSAPLTEGLRGWTE